MLLKKFKKSIFLLILFLFIIPINVFAYSDKLIVGGQNIGITLNSKGILIVGTYEVNNTSPAKEANLKTGDIITKINGNKVLVLVGSTIHPMEENHYIMWIYLETNMGIKRVKLNPLDEAKATFALLDNEEVISAYAYCNLHGLWIKEME